MFPLNSSSEQSPLRGRILGYRMETGCPEKEEGKEWGGRLGKSQCEKSQCLLFPITLKACCLLHCESSETWVCTEKQVGSKCRINWFSLTLQCFVCPLPLIVSTTITVIKLVTSPVLYRCGKSLWICINLGTFYTVFFFLH